MGPASLGRIVSLHVKSATPVKKGSFLYTVEKGQIKIFVVASVGSKNIKLFPGRTIPTDKTRRWDEEIVVPRDEGVFVTTRGRGSEDQFYADLDKARGVLFQASLGPIEREMREFSSFRKLRPETIEMMAKDWGIPVDKSLLQAQPVE